VRWPAFQREFGLQVPQCGRRSDLASYAVYAAINTPTGAPVGAAEGNGRVVRAGYFGRIATAQLLIGIVTLHLDSSRKHLAPPFSGAFLFGAEPIPRPAGSQMTVAPGRRGTTRGPSVPGGYRGMGGNAAHII